MKTKTHTISFFKGFFYVAFLAVTTGLYGQISKSKTEKIDALINSYTSIKQFNGNVLVVKKGKSVFFKNYGLSDMELQVPNKRETKFRIGSITKEFTAVLTMQLIEQGKINLDSSLVKYLPWYNRETGSKIKIKHLLSHTSGLDNYTVNPEFYNMMAYFSGQPKEFAEKYCQYDKLLFEPGKEFRYCNTDYYLLGLIIEAVTGKTYPKALSENILNKANMHNTGIDSISPLLPNRAKGYDYTYDGYVNADPINMASSIYAAGAMYSTVDDLLRWQQALNSNVLLTKESKEIFFTPYIKNHGFGFFINKLKSGKIAIGHPGGINGFSSFMTHFKEDDITIILLDNSTTHRRGNLDNISIGIYAILLNEPYETPKTPITVALTETYKTKGVQPMLDQYFRIKNDPAFGQQKSDTFLNDFGYTLLQKGKTKESLTILKLAAEENPKSANVLDSYAEALRADNQYTASIDYYKRALSLEPNNKRFREEILKLEEQMKK